jgi:hypothetical protein
MKPLKIEIAGVCAKIVCRDQVFAFGIHERYRDFKSTAEEDFVFYLDREVQPVQIRNGSESFRNGEQKVSIIPGKWKYGIVLDEDHQIKLGSIDINEAKVHLRWLPGHEIGSYFDLVFMHAIRRFLCHKGGLLLHASALVKDGRAFVFCGPDESGKSTISKMAPPSLIAADDSLAVRIMNGSCCLHTVPWGRKTSKNISAPIAKVFFLRKARELEVRGMALIEAVKEFLANTFFDTADEQVYAKTLETVHDLAERVSCCQLYFPLTGDYLDTLLSS